MELKLALIDVKMFCRDRCNRLAQCLFEGQLISIFTEAPASPIIFSIIGILLFNRPGSLPSRFLKFNSELT